MLEIQIPVDHGNQSRENSRNEGFSWTIENRSVEDQLRLSILRDLWNVNWNFSFDSSNRVVLTPPEKYNKEVIRHAMSFKRKEIIYQNSSWIVRNLETARKNLAKGKDVLRSKIRPYIEFCETPKQLALFRILRYYWSSPYSEYVGRRIKMIIRDRGLPNHPVIGIAAIGSPIIHIPDRDNWVGWNKDTRSSNLVYAMDAYVLGAVPPYNHLLGGKLISYLMASNNVRDYFKRKYRNRETIIQGRKANDLAMIFTTSLFGRSSQYNRLRYKGNSFFQQIGYTKGFGTLHLSNHTFSLMLDYLREKNIVISNRFGAGPIWRMRVIRCIGDMLGFDSEVLLRHSFRRGIYALELAENSQEFLRGENSRLKYYHNTITDLTDHWRERWLEMRKDQLAVRSRVVSFQPEDFRIDP